jgi:hypothetical protein
VVNGFGFAVNFEPGNYPGFRFRNNIFMLTGNVGSMTGGKYTGATFENNQTWSASQKVPFTLPENRQDTAPSLKKDTTSQTTTEKPNN